MGESGFVEDDAVSGSRGNGSDGVGDCGGVEGKGSVPEVIGSVSDTELTTLVGAERHNARSAIVISVNMSCSCIVLVYCNPRKFNLWTYLRR